MRKRIQLLNLKQINIKEEQLILIFTMLRAMRESLMGRLSLSKKRSADENGTGTLETGAPAKKKSKTETFSFLLQ